jgi:hypothetical protein
MLRVKYNTLISVYTVNWAKAIYFSKIAKKE